MWLSPDCLRAQAGRQGLSISGWIGTDRPPGGLPESAFRRPIHPVTMAPVAFSAPVALPVRGAVLRRSGLCATTPRAQQSSTSPVPSPAAAGGVPDAIGAPVWLGSILSSRGPPPSSEKLAAAVSRGLSIAEKGQESGRGTDALPNRRQESWRFTDLRPLYELRCEKWGEVDDDEVKVAVERMVPEEVGGVLVFVDGEFRAGCSRLDEEESVDEIRKAGGHVGGLEGFSGDVDSVLAGFEKAEIGSEKGGIFAAISQALARDVCVISIPEGLKVSKPLAVVCLASGGSAQETATACAPRIAIRAASKSSITVLETHGSLNAGRPWSCVMSGTSTDVEKGAHVEHYLLNSAAEQGHVVSHVHADVAKDATYKMRGITLGAQVGRISLGIDLNEEGAHGEAFGVMIADGKRVADLHSRIAHNAPSCTSNQYQKNIAGDSGRVIFSGKILVKQIAQETDSEQLCRSMLLTNKARIDAMPVLEIEADQVKCTHGATVSDLSQEELFYLLSRGISKDMAQELLLSSFVLDVLSDCPFGILRDMCTEAARKLIPGIQTIDPQERSELYQSV